MRISKACFIFVLSTAWLACGEDPEIEIHQQHNALNGVPEDGYPNYQERLMLVAVNRARSDPNSEALGISGSCGGEGSSEFAVSDPMLQNNNASRAARFHCGHIQLNDGSLSHNSYCTLRSDIGTSGCDGAAACGCEAGTEAFNCTIGGGTGTNPWIRTSYFGFSASGEVGACGYSDGWSAVAGWVTECPDYHACPV